MAMCQACRGSGQIEGSYKPCYSCSGRGCIACGQTGTSSQRERFMCSTCGGTGNIPDAHSPNFGGRSTPTKQKVGSAAKRKPSLPAFVAGYAGGALLLSSYYGLTGWDLILISLLPALVVAAYWQSLLVLAILGFVAWSIFKQ